MAAPQDKTIAQLAERIAPHLQECGVVGFVLAGYVTNAEGKVTRMTMASGPDEKNAAIGDGLRKMQNIAIMWGQGAL